MGKIKEEDDKGVGAKYCASASRMTIGEDMTLLGAMGVLNGLSGGRRTLFVVRKSGVVLGSVTDGDIRRALLGGRSLSESVVCAVCYAFSYLHEDGRDDAAVIADCRARGIRMVPRLRSDGSLMEVVDLEAVDTILPIGAILMAGGRGERLRPLTLTCPKPLIEVEGKAIMAYNVEALLRCGIDDVCITTHYLGEQIERYVAARADWSGRVRTVREKEAMGTIGSAVLAKVPDQGDTLVMNSDLLTTISYEELYRKHIAGEADITVAVTGYQVSVPYAILTTKGEEVQSIEEKPTLSFYANAGIYLFKNKVLHGLPLRGRTDATDLIEKTIAAGGRVSYYVIKGTWIDVGSPGDLEQARQLMRHYNEMKGI